MSPFRFVINSRSFLLFEEYAGNSTESSSINNDEIWKPQMREVRFENAVLEVYFDFVTVTSM